MNIHELQCNEELRQTEFPVTRHKIFLAHAGVSPLPRRVTAALRQYAEQAGGDDQETVIDLPRLLHETRDLAARLLNADLEEVALVGPTSLALSFVASGIAFRKGHNVVIYHDDYPSNVYPWMALAERGVEVRLLNIRELGKIRAVDVQGHVDEQTRLVALASCHFISGWRINLPAIGKYLRQRGILFCVDAIQTLGAFPTSVEHVDFLAADAHKWLLGPCAAGLLYVRKGLLDQFRPPVYGWHSVRCPNFVAQERIVHPPDARRYEAGSANVFGLVGLRASLELLLELGVENIAAELIRKRNWLVPALQDRGYTVLLPSAPSENAGAILSFFRPSHDMSELYASLTTAQVMTSLRTDRGGQNYIRLSPHFYNTDAELQRFLALL